MLILIFVISIDWSTWQLGGLYMHILMFHNIYNIACYDCLGFSISSTRAVWLIAHAATTSLMVDENVRRPTLGIILPDASPSVFPRAGRWSTIVFKTLYSFFFCCWVSIPLSQQRIGTCNCGTYVLAMKRSKPSYEKPKRAAALIHQRYRNCSLFKKWQKFSGCQL